MLRGTDAQQLQLPLSGLAVFAIITLTLASLRFRKTL
jgi:ABC-2 type transport system permease protein